MHSTLRSMACAGLTALMLVAGSAKAGLIEDFNYPDGPLTTSSGGNWQLFSGGAGDATVLSGAAETQGDSDVIRLFGGELTGVSGQARLTFDVNISAANSGDQAQLVLMPSSDPTGTNSNYPNALTISFDEVNTGIPGVTGVRFYGGDFFDANSFQGAGTITAGATHQIVVEMTKSGSTVSYTAAIDGTSVVSGGSIPLADARGLNAIETFGATDDFSTSGQDPGFFATYDNISFVTVPEPATGVMLMLASLGLALRRRHG